MSTAATSASAAHNHSHGHLGPQPVINFHHEDGEDEEGDDDDDAPKPKGADKKSGRRKIKIEFINDKSRRHITFSKRKAGIMKKAYELSTLTGTQVLLLVVSETGLVYTFTTAKLQPLVTQPEGKNLIQACLNAPAGQIPTGAPIGQTGAGVHQANIHPPQPQPPPGPVPATHPASGVPHGLPPPSAMAPPPRNIPGGLSIGQDKRNPEDDDDMEDEDEEQRSPTDEPPSPVVGRSHSQRSPPGGQPPMQRQISHHGAPGQPRPSSATAHSARGAHHGTHPYAMGGPSMRDPNVGGHRRRTSSGGAGAGQQPPPGGKMTSPRTAMSRQASNMSNISEPGGGMEGGVSQSPTMQHYPPHPPESVYAPYQSSQGHGGPPPPGGYAQPPGPPGSWGPMQQGVHPGHRR